MRRANWCARLCTWQRVRWNKGSTRTLTSAPANSCNNPLLSSTKQVERAAEALGADNFAHHFYLLVFRRPAPQRCESGFCPRDRALGLTAMILGGASAGAGQLRSHVIESVLGPLHFGILLAGAACFTAFHGALGDRPPAHRFRLRQNCGQ
jgi:hypothetical protein